MHCLRGEGGGGGGAGGGGRGVRADATLRQPKQQKQLTLKVQNF